MKRRTYDILNRIPIVNIALVALGYYEMPECSQGMQEGLYEPIWEYQRKHPDEFITNRMAEEILAGERK